MSEHDDDVMAKWKDAYLLELDLWSANETPMRESLFGAGMRHACAYKDRKRITELKDMLKDIKNAGSFAVCIEIATEALSEGGGD